MAEKILLALLGSGNIILFIKFLIERYDRKQEREEEKKQKEEDRKREDITGTLKKLEKDGLRTQLLLLILMKPKEETEILTIAEHYFKKPPAGLGGNWYMTSMFKTWLKENTVTDPEWFEAN